MDCLRAKKNCVHIGTRFTIVPSEYPTLPYFARLLLKRSDTVVGAAKSARKNHSVEFFRLFSTQWC